MARLSLKDQLAAIEDVAPAELDPEQEEEVQRREVGLNAQDHYLPLDSSSLRQPNALQGDARYTGKVASRKSLLEEDEDEEDLESDQEESQEGSREDEGSDEDAGDLPSEDEEEDEMPKDAEPASATFASDERAMIQQLKQAASADIEKGRDVRKQLAFWDTLLEGRIRLQKVLGVLPSLPQPAAFSSYQEENEDGISDLQSQLAKLSDSIFTLREGLLSSNSSVDLPPRKKRRTDQFDLDASLKEMKALDQASLPHLKSTITKWSDKVAAASAANRFTDRNTWSQIESTLSADGDKLVSRTRKSRALGATAAEAIEDPEIFDDGDFYQQLLKDVVESRSLDLDDGTLASLRAAGMDRSKKKKVVDTKASKGRKLRYHVHEKLVHFMAPQPQPMPEGGHAWHEGQINELFNSLLGKGFVQPVVDEPAPVLTNGTSDAGTLRIFG